MTFLDTAIVIYLIEQPDDPGLAAKARFEELENSPVAFVSTELVRMKCLVAPTRNGGSATIHRFDRFLIPPHVQLVLIDRSVSNRAVGIRATFGFKSLASLQLAAAMKCRLHRLEAVRAFAVERASHSQDNGFSVRRFPRHDFLTEIVGCEL